MPHALQAHVSAMHASATQAAVQPGGTGGVWLTHRASQVMTSGGRSPMVRLVVSVGSDVVYLEAGLRAGIRAHVP